MILAAAFVFCYYTVWAMLLVRGMLESLRKRLIYAFLFLEQPFLEKTNPIHDYFPPREWAVRLPAFIFVAGVGSIGSFIGMTIRAENKKKALKARQRAA